jgi:hypothetical protein
MIKPFSLKNNYYSSRKKTDPYTIAIWLILALGIFVRLYHFFYNRSLWEDEIYLSEGIVNRTFTEILTKPLPYLQKAPLGYLLISKVFTVLFGNQEMALRLYSCICGVVSLFVFVPVARHYLNSLGVIIALTLLAFSPPLVYHSVEAKPYGTELLATILILRLYLKYQNQTQLRQLLAWGIFGAIIIWFVYPGIFVLAATGLTAAVIYLKKKNYKAILRLLLPASLWLISFGVSYLLYAREGSGSGWLVDFWQKHDSYMPVAPLPTVLWLLHRMFYFLHYPLGLSWFNNWAEPGIFYKIISRMAIVPILLMVFGIRYFYQTNKRFLLLLGAALLVALAVSVLKLYPFHERLTVYLAPYILILIAGGCEFLFTKKLSFKVLQFVLIVLLVFGPIKNTISQIIHPDLFGDYKKSYQREALLYVNKHFRSGDAVYIYRNDIPGYLFYKQQIPLQYKAVLGNDYRCSTNNFHDYFSGIKADLNAIQAKRIWVIYGNWDINVGEYMGVPAWYYQNQDGVQRFSQFLLQNGKIIEEFKPEDGGKTSNIHAVLLEMD